MDEHLAELVRQWLMRYRKRGEALSRSRAFHLHLLAKDAWESGKTGLVLSPSEDPDDSGTPSA